MTYVIWHGFARYPNDDWHLANVYSSAYYSVAVSERVLSASIVAIGTKMMTY